MNEEVQLFRALSDKTRLKIIDLLLESEYCVGALAKQLEISEPSVSQHLKVLRQSGLVRGEKRGYWTHYIVVTEALSRLEGVLSEWTEKSKNSGCCKEKKDKCQ